MSRTKYVEEIIAWFIKISSNDKYDD